MSKIARFDGNLKAFASEATVSNRTVFNSENKSNILNDNINESFAIGWEHVGPNGFPTMEDFNAMGFSISQLIAYLHQVGVPEWSDKQEYHLSGITNYEGELYRSLENENTGNNPTTSKKWENINSTLLSKDEFAEHNTLINPHNITAEQLGAATLDDLNALRERFVVEEIKIFLSDNATAGINLSVLSIIPVDGDDEVGVILLESGENEIDFNLETSGIIQESPTTPAKDYVLNVARSALVPETTYRVRAYIKNNSGDFNSPVYYSNIISFTSSGNKVWNIDVYSRGATSAATAKGWALSMINWRSGDSLKVQWRQNYSYGTGNGTAVGARRITNEYVL